MTCLRCGARARRSQGRGRTTRSSCRTTRSSFRLAVLLPAALLFGALLVACGSSPPGASPPRTSAAVSPAGATSSSGSATSPAASSPPSAGPAPPDISNVFRHPLRDPSVSVTRGLVFVSWQTSPPGNAAVHTELARIDPGTGHIQARQRFAGLGVQELAAGGALWVVAWTGPMLATETLWKLNQRTLQVVRRWDLGAAGEPSLSGQELAIAGGWLWAADGSRLLRLSLPSGTITASIRLPGAATSDLSADAAGTMLIVGEADRNGSGAVQRRDPASGALIASHPVEGVTAPAVSGPVGAAVWISEATGMMGYVEELNATSMTVAGPACEEGRSTSACRVGTNDITASLANGLLWVTQVAGGRARNYCAEPVSDQMLAPIRLPRPDQDVVLAIGPDQIFYVGPARRSGSYLRREPIPSACRA